jgi:hypothetical protein
LRTLATALALLTAASPGMANTLTQNVSWIIDRADTPVGYRLVAYGDSLYSGYNGSVAYAAKYSAPVVDGEYLSAAWKADIEVVRRTKTGAVASDIYYNKVVAERSYMQAAHTRVVALAMCGNDALQARTAFKSQTGTCDYSGLAAAVNTCRTYLAASMDFINANAYPGVKLKIVSNVYYPGFDADWALSSCRDATTGTPVNMQTMFLGWVARLNFWICRIAWEKNFQCADNFGQYMAVDYDSNGDGIVDSEALRYVPGEDEVSYYNRITRTLHDTIHDANRHLTSRTSSADYIQSDDIHPTYTGETVRAGIFGGTSGVGPPRHTSPTKSSIWNLYGTERMGWTLSTSNPAAP